MKDEDKHKVMREYIKENYILKEKVRDVLDGFDMKLLTEKDTEEFYEVMDEKGYPRFITDAFIKMLDGRLPVIIKGLKKELGLEWDLNLIFYGDILDLDFRLLEIDH